MGLDSTIYKKEPGKEIEELKYWRKNWVVHDLMNAENTVDLEININDMIDLLNKIPDTKDNAGWETKGWNKEMWNIFTDEISEIIKDMDENPEATYTYYGWF